MTDEQPSARGEPKAASSSGAHEVAPSPDGTSAGTVSLGGTSGARAASVPTPPSLAPGLQRTLHSTNSSRSSEAFDLFMGFVYATTIALVIGTAYGRSFFSSLLTTSVTLLLLAFFAFDWHSRVAPRRRLGEKKGGNKWPLLFRCFCEIVIVFCLLLVCLKIVELFTPSAWTERDRHLIDLSRIPSLLLYSTSAFALASAIWNWLVIWDYKIVKYGHIRLLLFRGHLAKRIVGLFPDIEKWLREMKTIDMAATEAAIEGTETFDAVVRKRDQKARRHFHVNCIRLILPYFFAYHVVLFNTFLGLFLLACALFSPSASLLGRFPILSARGGSRFFARSQAA